MTKHVGIVVPDVARSDPILPRNYVIRGHIWRWVVEGMEPAHTHLVYDERRWKWRKLVAYIEGDCLSMIRAKVVVIVIRIIDKNKSLCLFNHSE